MSTATTHRTALITLGHLFFLSWIVLSVIFYQERIINFDSAYYTFNLLVEGDFYFAHQRYISAFTQWLPLLLIKLNAPLSTVLLAYSLAFSLLYYALFLIAVYVFRHPAGGLFIALTLVLTMRYKFWMAVSETPSTLAFAAFLIAWLSADKTNFNLKKWQEYLMNCGLILLVAMGHPLVVLPVGVYYVFDLLYHRKWKDWTWYATFGFTILVYAYRFLAIPRGSYESGRISMLTDAPQILTNLNDYFVTDIILRFLETEYHLPLIVFVGLTAVLIYQKQRLAALWLWASTFGLLALIVVTCSYLNGKIYGLIDGYLGWIGLVWSIPLLFLLKNEIRYRWLVLGITTVLLVFSWQRTLDKRHFFQHRLTYFEQLIEENRTPTQGKFILPSKGYDWDRMWYQWAIGIETLLLSSLDDPQQATTIYVQDWAGRLPENVEDTGDLFFHVNFHPLKYQENDLPQQYFALPTGKYRLIP